VYRLTTYTEYKRTTAGWRSSFAYSKLIELLIMSLIEPDEVMIMGGTYETPVVEGLLDEDFVDQLKSNGTYAEDSFDREYKILLYSLNY
jgi:hypothetical protein